ncbi:MAG TPA: hypothetical protein DEH78_33300 [Solibacterales bacterium]|nr:hypothetical protein [Bryobacterales bacterium]
MRTLLLLAILLPTQAQSPAVFRKVFSGVTTAQASAALPGIGQSMHLITVVFPSEAAPVNGIQVRIEASFDGSSYFPVSRDITSAPLLGGLVYQVAVAYAPWPYVRVRSLTSTPAMTVYYAGHIVPVVPAIQQTLDRFLL